ncbi:asparagine synthase-related protein [Methanonatronarchaeum sp. AMET6-2]|uniref:asparagine synthase-related protein n=1 Tax=Methanonatronarchaeum sp. AMET6-2 TaxID=2933293 RepID=UPI001FF526FE|nr:asparagine synthase-related protein [Methanonatronarchaeum sp. AMET6-2]UOY10268.1 asparagine synthase-related protein [Methanonatronarchaeum sp. AMET6-2]
MEISFFDKDFWTRYNDTYVCGKAFYKDKLFMGKDFAKLFDELDSFKDFKRLLSNLNGFYGLIKRTEDHVIFATDHIGSIPIFYSTEKNKDLILSDSFNQVLNHIDSEKWGPISITEFLLAGYSSGPNTIHKNIKRLQAGEIINIDLNTKEIKRGRHFIYRNNPKPIKSKEKLLKQLKKIMGDSFERTKKVAGDKPIILGLSGGLDSRLIATMLKKTGYENVHTYVHNLQDKEDIPISKKVAQDLGFNWKKYNHTHKEIKKTIQLKKYQKLTKEIGFGGGSVITPQGLLNNQKNQKNNEIPNQGLKLVGHTSAAPGGFTPTRWGEITPNSNISKESFIKGLLRSHHTGLKFYWESDEVTNYLKYRLLSNLPLESVSKGINSPYSVAER